MSQTPGQTASQNPGYANTQLLIDGQWCDAADGRTLAVVNPAHGKEIGRVAHAGRADLDRALAAAQKGFDVWRAVPAVERGKIMRKAAVLLRERAPQIAALMTQEQGKPLGEAKIEVLAGADIIDWFAEEGASATVLTARIPRGPGQIMWLELVVPARYGPAALVATELVPAVNTATTTAS